MPSNTPELSLLKMNPATDGALTFNIETMLNENWDKVDTFAQNTDERLDAVEAPANLTHTQTEAVKTLPTGTLDGVVDNFTADGLSLVNSVVNGDFANGTTGWVPYSSTLTATGKVLTVTGNNNDAFSQAYRSALRVGDKFFVYAKMRVTNAVCNAMRITDSIGTTAKEVLVPTQNVWYEMYGIIQSVAGASMVMTQLYTNAATNNGKVMEIDGNAGVFAINMTALGIASYTEAQMLDLVRGGYFDGLKGVANAEVKTVGKNLFDKTTIAPSRINETNGDLYNDTNADSHSDYIQVNGSTAYVTSGIFPSAICACAEYDAHKRFIKGYAFPPSNGFTITTDARARYFRMNINTTHKDTTQFEFGTVATAYEPHKSSRLTITPTLRSLPNGVHDRVYEADGQVWLEKRVAEKTLVAGDIGFSALTNIDIVTLLKSTDDSAYGVYVGDVATAKKVLYSNFTAGTGADSVTKIGIAYDLSATLWAFVLSKGTYANLAAAQAALAGTVIHYQLATPQLINLTAEGLTEGELMAFENGTVYLDADAFHVPSASFDVPTNTGAVIQSLVESANAQAKAIESKASKEQEDWIAMTMVNGWTGAVKIMKDAMGFVHFKGAATGGVIGQRLFLLPIGYRPYGSEVLVFPIESQAAFGRVVVASEVICDVGNNLGVSLNGITFRAEA